MANIALVGSEKQYGIVLQSVFGTAELDSVDLITANNGAELQSEHFSLKNALNVRKDPAANGTRFMHDGNVLVDTNESMPEFPIVIPTVRQEFLDLLLAAFFQNVVEDALSPFGKTFDIPVDGAVQQPDFSSDAGFFYTVFSRHPTASRSRKAADSICQQLTISCEPSGKISFSCDMVARGAIDGTSDPSGTWTRFNSAGFHYANADRQTIDFGAGAQTVALKNAWTIVLSQTLMKCGQDNGEFENYGITERGGTFNIPIQDDVNTMTAFVNAAAGTAIDINIGYGNASPGTDDGDFDIAIHGKLTEDVERDYDGVMSAVLVGELYGLDKDTSPATIIIANDIDRGF